MPRLPALPTASLLDSVNGLPTHALLVHFAVVVSTSATIGGLAYVFVPRFRRWLSYPLMALGAASIVLGIVTPSSGESLEKRVDPSPLLEKHTELGGQMGTIMIVFGVVLILAMLAVRYRGSSPVSEPAPTGLDRFAGLPGQAPRAFGAQPVVAAVLVALVLVGSIVSGIWIYRTGDAGAKSVWEGTPTTPVGDGPSGK